MSGLSEDEVCDDGLQIKPPQPHRLSRHREDRNHRRWGSDQERKRGGGVPRRRDQYYQQRGEIGHSSSSSRDRRGTDDDRIRKRRHDDYIEIPRRDLSEPIIINRGHAEPRRIDQDQHSKGGDHRSKQLHKSVKQKRKHLEQEEQRALREIERRHQRERKEGQKRSSTSGKRRRKHELSPPNTPPRSQHDLDKNEEEESTEHQKKNSQEADDMPIVEEFVKSSPEVQELEEDGSQQSQHESRPYHSDVSSGSDMEQGSRNTENPKPSNPPSVASSKSGDSDSSSSKSDSDSEGSSSKSSDEGSDDENDGNKSRNGKKTPPETVMETEKSDVKASPDIEIIQTEKKVEKSPMDESLLTDVDRAIREVSLLPPYYPAVQGCRRVEEFSLLNRIEEGTYGVVYRAKDRRTNEVVALKRLKMEKEKDGFPITSLREINTLLKAQHENIVTVREIVVGSNTDKIFLVMDYVEHDLKALMETLKQKSQMFLLEEVKCLMIQLLRAVAHLHDNWILHRDLKTSNLLLSHKGILKVGDFGLAREYGSPLKGYTPIVVTLWYRAPELLLGVKEYSTPIDVWSVGCIFGELLKMEPMFPGKSEANQLNLIFQTLGTPNDRIWPGYTKLPLLQKMTFVDQPLNKLKTRFVGIGDKGIDLMNKLLTYNPEKRITAEDAMCHGFFKESPLPIDPSVFPTWPAKSELGHRKAPSSPKPPSGGRQFKDLRDDDDSSGFFLGGTGTGDRRLPIGAGFSLKF